MKGISPLLVVISLVLTGCITGRDYNSSNVSELKIGETDRSALVRLFGEPILKETPEQNGKIIDMLGYYYTNSFKGSKDANGIITKRLTARLYNGKLFGFEYSTNDEDSTDFDVIKINSFEKGKTDKASVLAALGTKCGHGNFPTAKKEGSTALIYWYDNVTRFSGRFEKFLFLEFDERDVLIDIDAYHRPQR